MRLKSLLLAVSNMAVSIEVYRKVLHLRIVADFGANVTLTGGLCLQILDTWQEFIEGKPIAFGANAGEMYFEEDDFDAFVKRLQKLSIDYVHRVKEYRWGQRVVRFYDPDKHMIEVGENLKSVCRRFLEEGMTEQQAAERMDVPLAFIRKCKEQGREVVQ